VFSENNFHLIGAGGIGVSGLARLLRAAGKVVSGSDREPSPVTVKLIAEGFQIKIGEAAENLPAEVEVVIHTSAAREDNLELAEAKKRGLKTLTYAEALGEITRDKKLITVAGAHGKTTTTSLIVAAALAAGEDISCLVGTNLKELNGGNARLGGSDYFVIEACEYRRAFLNFQPEILVVTNIEAEHLDYYRDLTDYQSAFVELAEKLPAAGTLIASSAEANLEPVIAAAPKFLDSKNTELPELQLAGAHNRQNAALALRVATTLDWDLTKAKKGIENFTGGWRRFEKKGELNGALVFDDYGHHPTEIAATLAGAREKYPDRRILIVYQQHQLDRAAKMLTELGASFTAADLVLIPNLYAVRDETSKVKITADDLVAEIRKNGKEALHTEDFAKTATWLRENLRSNDLLLVMGAGDVFRLTELLLAD
jgi:UDP-N-acetylmuramate--alanine ligase